ncbi:MAG: alpha/beta hydrolase [Burkholderiales bacterium]
MPLDPKAKRIIDMMSAGAAATGASASIEARRDGFRKLMRMSAAPPSACGVEERSLPGPGGQLAARLYSPDEAAAGPLPGLVFFHGGGLVAGSLDTHDALCRTLAATSGCRVVSVAYRLAPEFRFPAAVEDACAASAWIAAHADSFGIDAARLAVGGDSAGGTLAAVVCQWARGKAAPRFAAQLLLCPVLDFAAISASRREFSRGYLLDEATMQRDLEHYHDGKTALEDPRISPLREPGLGGLPQAIIHTAEFDPLRDEGLAYAGRLVQAGVPVRHICHAGMIHHFYGMPGILPRAQQTLARIGADLGAALRGM